MRIWFDTEFVEDGKTIDLISIGLVREDGATYYAESAQADHSKASPWVRENVLAHLQHGDALKFRRRIAQEIKEFAGEAPEFWAYYADYDWVALCQLYGTMMNLPESWPMFCRDLQQAIALAGRGKPPEQTQGQHNALEDAMWTRDAWTWLRDVTHGGEGLLVPRSQPWAA